MSRLGNTPIELPKSVEVSVSKDGKVNVKGPKGAVHLQLPVGISLKKEENQVFVIYDENEELENGNALHGLYRALVKNGIFGVSQGFEVKLSLVGVGYRAAVAGQRLELQVGYSHPTSFEIPKTVQVTVEKGTSIMITGVDKHQVGQFAAIVRALKSPEPYKGKGIRYENEYVRKKEGKAAKAAAK